MKKEISVKERLVSLILEQITITFVMMMLFAPASMYYRINHPNVIGSPYAKFPDSTFVYYWLIFVCSLYFNKDIFLGRSIAKRILKLQIVDLNTNQPASPLKCLIRNLTLLIWPLEVVFALINPKQRLGDKIARTELVPFDKSTHSVRPSLVLILVSLVSAATLLGLIVKLIF